MTIYKNNGLFFLLLLTFIPVNIYALDLNYDVGLFAAKYTNINLELEPEKDEYAYGATAEISAYENTRDLYLLLESDIEYINYKYNIAEDRITGSLLTNIIWRIKPENFEWHIDNTYTQTLIDTLSSDSPDNRQNVNVFSTGPTYIARIDSLNNLHFDMRAEDYRYEQDDDNRRALLAARYYHLFNPSLTVSINSELESTTYTTNSNNDFKRHDSFMRMDYSRGENALDIEYGYTNIISDYTSDISEPRYLVTFTNLRTQSSTITMMYEYIASDAGRSIVINESSTSIDEALNNTLSSEIFIEKSLRLQSLNSTTNGYLNFEANTNHIEYDSQSQLNRKSYSSVISGQWNISALNQIEYVIRYINTDFYDSTLDRIDEDYLYNLNYIYGVSRNVNLNLEFNTRERQSTIDDNSYDDFRVILSLNYTSL